MVTIIPPAAAGVKSRFREAQSQRPSQGQRQWQAKANTNGNPQSIIPYLDPYGLNHIRLQSLCLSETTVGVVGFSLPTVGFAFSIPTATNMASPTWRFATLRSLMIS
jgi:hypothetical protein